jgi:hypothetical protein
MERVFIEDRCLNLRSQHLPEIGLFLKGKELSLVTPSRYAPDN